jgi:hypothetical protein
MHAQSIPPAGSSLRAPGFHRNERALLPSEVLRIHFREMRPLLRQIIQREDGGNRADRYACTTIDALDWVDVELRHGLLIHLVLLRVDAVHRAGIHTRCVFGAYARLGNDVCHFSSLLLF